MDKTALGTQRHPIGNAAVLLMAIMAGMGPNAAQAIDLAEGSPDWAVRWDNTVKLSTIYRLNDADPALKNAIGSGGLPQALNGNAGDQNFQKSGFVSERVDLLSEFDAVYQKQYGVRFSGVAWYDHAYHQSTDADNLPTTGQTPYNQFPERTRRLAGGDGEVFDAFVFGKWQLGDRRELLVRLGRHALQYGESLFFGDNAVARAQGPLDAQRALSSPNAQFREIIRPVPQVSAQLQLARNFSLGGYYQFAWEADRLPPSGSYFSTSNIPWGSSQPEFINGARFAAGPDIKPGDNGQFGLQAKWTIEGTDLGLYFARFHDKSGQLYGMINGAASNWHYIFPEGVKVLGVSASRSLDEYNLSAEASVRDDMPLRSTNMIFPAVASRPQPAKGKTGHLNVSWLASLGPSFVANEASFLGEVAWNAVLSADDPNNMLDRSRTRSATIVRAIYSPTYRQVLSGVDVSVPVSIGYTLHGASSVTPAWGAKNTGNVSIGLDGSYLDAWRFALTYQHYLGKAAPTVDYSPLATGGTPMLGVGNNLRDRDYMSLSLRRTF